MTYDNTYGTRKQQERKARQAEAARKSRILRMQVVGVAVCILAFTAMGFTILPQHHVDIPLTTVAVSTGDTVWDIAREHPSEGMTIEETVSYIKDVNGLNGATIKAGDELKVPATPSQEVASATF